MKRFIIPVIAAALIIARPDRALAQSSAEPRSNGTEPVKRTEKVVLQLDDDGKTEIEIKNGRITVDGEEVMSLADAVNGRSEKTIIIEGARSGGSSWNPFSMEGASGQPRAALGVQFEAGETSTSGAVVKEVTAGSAAEKAGLKAGDVITKVDDASVTTGQELAEAISTYKPGEEVTVVYKRGTKTATVKAKLGEVPATGGYGRSFRMGPDGKMEEGGNSMPNGMNTLPFSLPPDLGSLFGETPSRPKLGITGEDLTEGDGVLVKDVTEDSPADKADLKKGDVITAVGGTTIGTLNELKTVISRLDEGTAIDLTYKRNGAKQKTKVTFPKSERQEQL